MKRLMTFCAIGALIFAAGASPANAGITVEFSEVDLPALTLLDGTSYFDPYGLAFEDTTYYAIDSAFSFVGAGVDDRGITTTSGADNLMTIVLLKPATHVRVDWVSVNSGDIYTTVYGADGGVLFNSFSTGTSYGADTYEVYSGPPISKLTFHDGNGMIGVGRIEFEPIPAPGAILLGSIGVGVVSWLRRRKAL